MKLKNRKVKICCDENKEQILQIFKKYGLGAETIPSEGDTRLCMVRNYNTFPELFENYLDTSTLSAIKDNLVKIILPKEIGSRVLRGL